MSTEDLFDRIGLVVGQSQRAVNSRIQCLRCCHELLQFGRMSFAPNSGKMFAMKRAKMSDEEKTARRAVREYLTALEVNKPKRGRKRTPESIEKRLGAIAEEVGDATPLKKLELAQERIDLSKELENLSESVDMESLEADFVAHAKAYGEAKGLSYSAWRDVGVSAETLKAASISRGS